MGNPIQRMPPAALRSTASAGPKTVDISSVTYGGGGGGGGVGRSSISNMSFGASGGGGGVYTTSNTAPVNTPRVVAGTMQLTHPTPTIFTIYTSHGVITLNMNTGEISIPPTVPLTDAAKELWETFAAMQGSVFNEKIRKEAQQLFDSRWEHTIRTSFPKVVQEEIERGVLKKLREINQSLAPHSEAAKKIWEKRTS